MRKHVFPEQQRNRSGARSHSLICACVIRCLNSILSLVSISDFKPISNVCSRIRWYNPKTGFLAFGLNQTLEHSIIFLNIGKKY